MSSSCVFPKVLSAVAYQSLKHVAGQIKTFEITPFLRGNADSVQFFSHKAESQVPLLLSPRGASVGRMVKMTASSYGSVH